VIRAVEQNGVVTCAFMDEHRRLSVMVLVSQLFNTKADFYLQRVSKDNLGLLIQALQDDFSENEDGGVYFAPELVPSIEKGLLKLHYAHGRYGYWAYQFRLEGRDMRLIGYDSSDNFGPYVNSETSVNFLTAKKLVRENLNKAPDSDPKFKETWSKVNVAPMYLSTIQDIDDLSFE